ncbi:Crp/Fnr family transcriptional regulator [Frankia sp. R82]|nr:Crp/Fnr family transcriptional regulator [Frankia sp. R82]
MREGDRTRFVAVVLSGWAKVVGGSENGQVALLAIRRSGDLVGELAAMDAAPRLATVVAAGPVSARVLPAEVFLAYLRHRPQVHQVVSGTIGAKFRSATRRRVEFAGYSVALRVVRVLLELGQLYETTTVDRYQPIVVPLAQPELAALVGAAEPTVHKVLRDLRQRGVLSTGYRAVAIRDLDALRAELSCVDTDWQPWGPFPGSVSVAPAPRAAGA